MKGQTVLVNLKRFGAPLCPSGRLEYALSLEETLAHALRLSRGSPTVAQTWPVVFAKHLAEVDLAKLESMACRLGEAPALGFFLDVLQRLLPGVSFGAFMERLKAHVPEGMRYFFRLGQGDLYKALTRSRTPEVASTWGFWMNTDLADFAACLRKFLPVQKG